MEKREQTDFLIVFLSIPRQDGNGVVHVVRIHHWRVIDDHRGFLFVTSFRLSHEISIQPIQIFVIESRVGIVDESSVFSCQTIIDHVIVRVEDVDDCVGVGTLRSSERDDLVVLAHFH